MGISCDGSIGFVCKNRISGITFPCFHIFRKGYPYTFPFQTCFHMAASRIIEHNKGSTQRLILIPIDGTLILSQLFPPLGILVMDTQNGLIQGLPLVCSRQISFRPCQTDKKRCLHSLVPRSFSTDVSHPMTVLISLKFIASSPLHIRQGRKSTSLIAIPFTIPVRENPPQCAPLKQIITFRQPGFITTAVCPSLTVINNIGHQPFVSLTEDRRAIYFMVIVLRGNHQSIFIGCFCFFENLFHPLLRNITLSKNGPNRYHAKECQ